MLHRRQWVTWVPLIFVLLWSTGFIAAKFALPFIEPFTLLFVRMSLSLLVFFLLIQIFDSEWPKPIDAFHQMVVGSLIHAAYLGGLFAAVKLHMSAGLAALIVGLQPILTAVFVWLLFGAALLLRQWLGLLLGLLGVTVVLLQSKNIGLSNISSEAMMAIIIALFGISLGTLYQKQFGQGAKLLTGSFYQYLATMMWMGLFSFSFETQHINWTFPLIGALAWLVIVLSIVTILLLMLMIREGESARVASYFYLVTPIVAVEGWLLSGEQLNSVAVSGMGMAVLGVYLVIRNHRRVEI